MLFSFDGTFVVQLINFAIFFALLNVLFLRPVGKAVAQRRAYLDGLVGGYEKAQSEANALRREAEEVRNEARREADAAIARERARMHEDGVSILAEFSKKANDTIDAANDRVRSEVEALSGDLKELREQLAEQLLAQAVPELKR